MDIDYIIEGLNKKGNISHITVSDLESTALTELEKTFIDTYKPGKVLISYGTLAPNRSNHSVVEHIKGIWLEGIIKGQLENLGWGAELGYLGFRHVPIGEQEEIKAFILISDELVANWKMLDEFEGEQYRRILSKYELENGEIGVGYIYAINQKDE